MSTDAQREQTAADAVLLLLTDGLIEIRTMASTQQPLLTQDGAYLKQIWMIADICHNLPGSLRSDTEATAITGLQFVWDTANESKRRWLRSSLAPHGIDVADVVDLKL
jgi:hypothetical protein